MTQPPKPTTLKAPSTPAPLAPTAERWALAAGAATGALLALGPLEVRDATVALGALRFTSTELLAALALLVGLVGAAIAGHHDRRLRDRMVGRLRAPVAAAMVLWGVLHVVSTFWATVWPLEALKFSLRVCGGIGLGLVGLAWGGEPSYVRRAMIGLRVGVALITGIGIIERLGGQSVEPALAMFRDEPTWMLGEQRLSTVFGHANTLAAYLELTLPVLLLLAARTSSRWRWPARIWLVLAILMLSLTYSRAGLLAGLLGLACVGFVAYRRQMREVWRHVVGAVLLLAISYLGNPDMRGRLGLEERRYDVLYRMESPCAGAPGERVELRIFVRNDGQWPLTNRQAPGDLAIVKLPEEGPPESQDFHYMPLPNLGPSEGVTVTVAFDLPDEPRWQPLMVDIRRKNVLWLSSVGVEPGHFVCRVAAPGQRLPPRGTSDQEELRFEHRPHGAGAARLLAGRDRVVRRAPLRRPRRGSIPPTLRPPRTAGRLGSARAFALDPVRNCGEPWRRRPRRPALPDHDRRRPHRARVWLPRPGSDPRAPARCRARWRLDRLWPALPGRLLLRVHQDSGRVLADLGHRHGARGAAGR